MQLSLKTTVVVDSSEGEAVLDIEYHGNDVLTFYLDGKEIFAGDWSSNFAKLFQKALDLFKEAFE